MSDHYLARVAKDASIGVPTMAEMELIANTDSRQHRREFTPKRYEEWADTMAKQGFFTGWRVARESGRLLAHIWFVMRDGVATICNVQVCAYAATKLQVCAMLLDAERIMWETGASTICYLTSATEGSPYDDAFEACGYVLEKAQASFPKGSFVLPIGGNGQQAAVRWRVIESTMLTDERMRQAALCLDPSLSTPGLLPPALG